MVSLKINEEEQKFLSYIRKESVDPPDYIVDVAEPELFKEEFPWDEPPRMALDGVLLQPEVAEKIWLSDTTFRDGQQAREPYTVDQIVSLYTYLNRLGGPQGRILHSEFFLYTKKDREAVERCRSLGYEFPKVTGWIRAVKEDLELIKAAKIEETGILASISDYHIFYKFHGLGRMKVIEKYLRVAEEALKNGIIPRVHVEDITRANIFRVVVPFVRKVMRLSEKYGLPVKIRIPDTLGLGVPWVTAALPRSIPKLTWVLRHVAGVPSEWLEFHGHNDFHLGVANSASAWMYGASLCNCTLLGIGERAGNVPLEAMVFQYAALKRSLDGMDTTVITDIAEYYEREVGYRVPSYYPLVGRNFNTTRAGIHVDGLLKAPGVYLSFDTEKLLKSPPGTIISERSGLAGITFWVNYFFKLKGGERVAKDHPGVRTINEALAKIYSEGRITAMGNEEMVGLVQKHLPEVWEKYKDRANY